MRNLFPFYQRFRILPFVLRALSLHPRWETPAGWVSNANFSMTTLRLFGMALFRTAFFPGSLIPALDLRQTRMVILRLSSFRWRQKCAIHLRCVPIFIHRKGRLHCHRHETEEQTTHPAPTPHLSVCVSISRSLFPDDLHITVRTDLEKPILGVYILPKDEVKVA